MDNLVNSLSEALKGIDFSTLLKTIIEAGKQLIELLKPLLGNLTSTIGSGTTDPTTTTTA